ncbi:hypothetical protein [Celeribacter sp.]|uniref:hypothetical protein n=1 Tax=Celeribacter sp. TaxID=1890673 RepID=UPI003A959406
MLKSYLRDDEKTGLSQNGIYLAESQAASEADDTETEWAWLRKAVLPAHSLLFLKHSKGADWVRNSGLQLHPAAEKYGADWLDNDI